MRRAAVRRPSDAPSESYLESLSDLLIGLLFIFIIILMSFALNLKVAQSATDVIEKKLSDAGERRSDLLLSLKTSMAKDGVQITLDKNNGVLRLPESLLFPEASADISPQGMIALRELARHLRGLLPCYTLGAERAPGCPIGSHAVIDSVFIEGHTDDIPIFSDQFRDNWDLSAARSRSTYDALVSSTPELLELKNATRQSLLSISAYGATRPVEGYRSKEETRRHSRRIDLRFIIGTPADETVRL